MVEFILSEEQEMLRELAHEFARDTVRPNAEHWDANSEFPPPGDVWGGLGRPIGAAGLHWFGVSIKSSCD